MSYTYIIKPKIDITQSMIDVCVQDSVSSIRTSVDGLLGVLKWSGGEPPIFSEDTKYTHDEILVEMNKLNWKKPGI